METKRNIGLDLLRIISMLMIVMLHYLGKGGALSTAYGTSTNYLSWIIEAFCIVAVNCYVYITGYFLVNSNFKIKKILKLWGQVLFYSLSIYFVLLFTNLIDFNIKEMIVSFMPIITKQYWFITVYILLYILSPFLNVMIKNLSKKQFKSLIFILVFVFCICTTLLDPKYILDSTTGYGIIWFICLYFIGAYIRLHHNKDDKKNIYNLLIYFVITVMVIFSRLIITYIFQRYNFNIIDELRFYQYNSISIFISSLFLFIYFKNLNITNNIFKGFILKIAPLTLGVYLIHDHVQMRVAMYNNILHTTNYLSGNKFLVVAVISVIFIFSVCIVIEYLRHKFAVYISKTKTYNLIEKFIILKYENILKRLNRGEDLDEKIL
ncbi:MAG: hypothetical protein K0R72_483 [Clostridia bacterium]|jgi:surface polysaccharide O-acyltransferase-like enzyme|nr:hypothetical protein [Clostridia bacterium]